jgi:hypothetical protein
MGDITNLDNFVQLLMDSGKTETMLFFKTNRLGLTGSGTTINTVAAVQGLFMSYWLASGIPSLGDIPTTATTCSRTTAGALGQTNPQSGNTKYLFQVASTMEASGTFLIYDRLVHCGGLSANTTAIQTVNTPQLTRYSGDSSVGNRIMLEIYETLPSVANLFPEVSYTNQDGVSGKSAHTMAIGGATVVIPPSSFIMTLDSGDTGVRSIESVRLTTSGATAGNFGVSIIRPLLLQQSPTKNAFPHYRDFLTGLPGFVKIENDACIQVLASNAFGGQNNDHLILTFTFIEV